MTITSVTNAKTVKSLVGVMDTIEQTIMNSPTLRASDPHKLKPVVSGAFTGVAVLIGQIDGLHGVFIVD